MGQACLGRSAKLGGDRLGHDPICAQVVLALEADDLRLGPGPEVAVSRHPKPGLAQQLLEGLNVTAAHPFSQDTATELERRYRRGNEQKRCQQRGSGRKPGKESMARSQRTTPSLSCAYG